MDDFSKYLRGDSAAGINTLKFRDKKIEEEFWAYIFKTKKKIIEITMLIIVVALIATSAKFVPYISDVLPQKIKDIDFFVRLFTAVIAAIGLVFCKIGVDYRLIQKIIVAAALLFGVSISSLMVFVDVHLDAINYFNFTFIHLLIYIYVLQLVPIRLSIIVGLFLSIFHTVLATMFIVDLGSDQLIFVLTPVLTLFIVLSYAGYTMEKSERSSFIYRSALINEYENSVDIQKQRSKWLGLVTDFLRHELKNSIIGVSSSLQLISRRNENELLDSYISRAENSTAFMKRLLEEASTSTSLESALNEMQMQEVNLSSLIEEKIGEYIDIYCEYAFEANVEENVSCTADPDRILQALDKLVNNAVEHCNQVYPIRIELFSDGGDAKIRVSNIGDRLNENADLFQPFVSSKSGSKDNFGFGLFVVKRIIEAHGGNVCAKSLNNKDGAEFMVSIPI